MTQFLLLLGLMLLQVSPELAGGARKPVERVPMFDEADVDSLTSLPGPLIPVRVETLEGVPAGGREREAFLKGFRGAFQLRDFPTERVAKKTGAVKPGGRVYNRLRLPETEDEKGAWTVRVRLEWFTPQDSTAGLDSLALAHPGRGARVTVTVGWPEGSRAVPPARPRTEWLRFPAGYPVDAAYHQHAGRQVGFLVLEAVQRAKGDLNDDQRLRLEETRRIAPPSAR